VIAVKIIHYPNLKTVIAVEEVLKNSKEALSREEIKRRLETRIMHQTLNVAISYLVERNLVTDNEFGVRWKRK